LAGLFGRIWNVVNSINCEASYYAVVSPFFTLSLLNPNNFNSTFSSVNLSLFN
jgi:hypothetical protein